MGWDRIAAISLLFLAAFIVVWFRLGYLQLWQHDDLSHRSKSQLSKVMRLYPTRGAIYDRNGVPLAITQKAVSLFANPKSITSPNITAKKIAWFIPVNQLDLRKKLKKNATFVWVARKVSEKTADKIRALKLPGIHFIDEDKRYYPQGTVASDVLGFVGIDNQGLGGLEYKFDEDLKGTSGTYLFEGDPRRNKLVTGKKKTVKSAYDGRHLVTTIDHQMQYFAEKYLAEQIQKEEAEKGYVVVLDPNNGEILALADYPSFDANRFNKSPYSVLKNGCVSDVYEPGSIFKVFTVAAALEEELVTPGSVLTVPEEFYWHGKTISEAHDREPEETDQKTVTEIFTHSLNVGTTLLAIKLGEEKYYRYLKSFGFGQKTRVQLPGESRGLFRPLSKWNKLDIATLSFGQGIAVTPLQMALSAAAVVNGGWLVEPHILRHQLDSQGIQVSGLSRVRKRRVLTPGTVKKMQEIMEKTVELGTGQLVQIPGYALGGKTGTAQKANPKGGGYLKGAYVSSFIGAVPINDPKVLILVSIDSPQKNYYGSTVAGPVFKKLAQLAIDRYGIHPQKDAKIILNSLAQRPSE